MHVFPSLDDLANARADDARSRGMHALAASVERAHAPFVSAIPVSRETPGRRLPRPVRALLVFVGLVVFFTGVAYVGTSRSAMAATCYEDMPCYVWAKDGNGARGVILRSARSECSWAKRQDGCITVVSVRRYCRLRKADLIDTTRTAHLKGDAYARDHGC